MKAPRHDPKDYRYRDYSTLSKDEKGGIDLIARTELDSLGRRYRRTKRMMMAMGKKLQQLAAQSHNAMHPPKPSSPPAYDPEEDRVNSDLFHDPKNPSCSGSNRND